MLDTLKIALYTAEKKELIGVFKSTSIAARYLYANWNTTRAAYVMDALMKKYGIKKNTQFNFRVAVRVASKDHEALLGTLDYFISPGYSTADKKRMQGFAGFQTDKL